MHYAHEFWTIAIPTHEIDYNYRLHAADYISQHNLKRDSYICSYLKVSSI